MMLSTVSKLKSHLGIPAHDVTKDAVLGVLLRGASEYLEGQTSRKFQMQSHTEKYSGDGSDMLLLKQYPILEEDSVPAITALTVDDVDVFSEIASGDIDVDAEKGILYRDSGWRSGTRNIVITYSAGYELPSLDDSGDDAAVDLPADLELAALRLAARVYERRTAEGTSSVSPSSYNVVYKDSIDPEIVQTIGKYTRVKV